MTITLRINDAEAEAIRAYADLHGATVSEVMRRAILEKIEDEHDLAAWNRAYAAYTENPSVRTQDEIEKEFGLQ